MFKRCLLIAFLAVNLTAQPVRTSEGELNVRQAVELLDGAVQGIRSFDIRVDCSRHFFLKVETSEIKEPGKKGFVIHSKRKLLPHEQPGTTRGSFRQVFQRGKGRIEFLSEGGDEPSKVVAYDGETMKAFHPKERTALIAVPSENIVPGEGWDYLHAYRNVQGHFPIVDCFKERRNAVVIAHGGDGSQVALETAPEPKRLVEYPPFGFRVVIDRPRGFMPAVIERFQEVQGKTLTVRQTRVAEWRDLGGGLWVPVKVVTRYFDQDTQWNTFGDLLSEEVLVVNVARSTWNKELPEETFDVALPAGTKVTNLLREVQFVTGKPDPGKNLDDLAATARNVVHYPVPRPPPASGQPWWLWPAVFGAAVVLAGAGLWFLRRRRRVIT